jgi:hypothetical protein
MTRLKIEPGEATEHGPCPDCGGQTRSVWGYAYADSAARALYFIRWTDGHLERGAQLLLSIGKWGVGTSPKDRRSVGLECRVEKDRPGFMVVNASSLPWAGRALLGEMLSREDALAAPISKEAFSIADRLVEDDQRFRSFLLSGKKP